MVKYASVEYANLSGYWEAKGDGLANKKQENFYQIHADKIVKWSGNRSHCKK
jgi:hypothetical protein